MISLVYDEMEEMSELLVSSLLSLLSSIPSALFGIAVYVILAICLSGIAKRRGIQNAWLAWIPIARVWILGAISDQYRHLMHGQIKSRRKVLLGLYIAEAVVSIVMLILCFATIIRLLSLLPSLDTWGMNVNFNTIYKYLLNALPPMLGVLVLMLPLAALSIVCAVFYYMALYDVFKSCEPENAVLYLVLSILINICLPIFLLVCYKKDQGMIRPAQPPQGTWQST